MSRQLSSPGRAGAKLVPGSRLTPRTRAASAIARTVANSWCRRLLAIGAGHERFKDSPHKNEHSHVGDAAGYCLLGSEHKIMTKSATAFMSKPTKAKVLEFDVFG